MSIDRAALLAGTIRFTSRVWFLIDPLSANRFWGGSGRAGADAADLLGGISVHDELKPSQRIIGLGGAVVGIGVGLWGAAHRTTRKVEAPAAGTNVHAVD